MYQYLSQIKSKTYQYFLLCLLFSGPAFAQNQLDTRYIELKKKLNSSPDEVLSILNKSLPQAQNNNHQLAQHHYLYSRAYISLTYPDKALEHAQLALAAVDDKKHPWLHHKILVAKVIALDYGGEPQKALPLANQVVTWAQNNNAKWLLVEALSARGHLYIAMSLSVNALNDFKKAYDMVPEKGGQINKGHIAIDMALVYENRGENELAIPFFEEAVVLHRSEKEFLDLSIALYGLGRANKNIGNTSLGKSQLEESARLAKKVNDVQGEAYAMKELAGIAQQAGQPDVAIEMLKKAYKTFEASHNKFMLLDTSFSLSRIYLSQGNLALAEQFIALSKTYLNPETMPTQNISIDELSAKIMALKGEYQAAYQLLSETIIKKDEIFTQTSISKLSQFKTQYDLANKEKENDDLKHQNELQAQKLVVHSTRNQLTQWLILASMSTSVLLAFIVFRSRKNRIKFEYMAQHDALTGMSNRSYCMQQIKQQLKVHHNNSLLLAMLDLDHFKHINDQFGHTVGDDVLIQFSKSCLNHFDKNVIIGRFGGEEFLLAMSYGDQHQLKRSLEQLKWSLSEQVKIPQDSNFTITFSAGISRCRGVEDLEQAIHRADMAMYSAKSNGRDQIILHREISK